MVTDFANDGGSSDGDEYGTKYHGDPGPARPALHAQLEAALKQWVVDFYEL